MMQFTPEHLSRLATLGISFKCNRPQDIRLSGLCDMRLEPPVELRRAIYDVQHIGAFTYLGSGMDSLLRHIGKIGRFCSIAANLSTGPFEHPLDYVSTHGFLRSFAWADVWLQTKTFYERNKESIEKCIRVARDRAEQQFNRIHIGNDVWIGESVFIRRGVKINDGAVIGSRAVVTKDVPPYAIVGGIPAKLIRYRFEEPIISELQRLSWWKYGLSALDGADFSDIDAAVTKIDSNIRSGIAEPYAPDLIIVTRQGEIKLSKEDAG